MTGTPEPEVFTKAFKIRGNIVVGCVTALAFFGPIVLGIGGAVALKGTLGDGGAAIAGLGGFALAVAGFIVASQKAVLIGNQGLRRDLAAALQRRFGRNPVDGTASFVGWSPGRGLNTKDGDTDHDVGFLTLTPEALNFLGDTVGFEVQRQQVRWVGPAQQGVPFLMDFGLRIAVYWVDAWGNENAFTFERREGRSRRQVRRRNRELAEILQLWHQYGTVADPAGQVRA